MKDLRDNIKTIRIYKGLSQEDMAEKLGITQGAYFKIETGKTNITEKRLNDIASALGVTVDDINNWNSSGSENKNEIDSLKALLESERRINALLKDNYDLFFKNQIMLFHATLEAISKEYNLQYLDLYELYEKEIVKDDIKSFDKILNTLEEKAKKKG